MFYIREQHITNDKRIYKYKSPAVLGFCIMKLVVLSYYSAGSAYNEIGQPYYQPGRKKKQR